MGIGKVFKSFPYTPVAPIAPISLLNLMSLALYRKYRPQKWSDLTGQNHIKITLQHEIESNKVAHAYLFTGPRGIGKTTSARLFAKALNCTNRKEWESEPCNQCDSCLELVAGNDLDIMEVDAASNTGVDNVRENIIASARFTPVKRKYKVFIIDEVHMLSISAFNALLKIMEEPPSHAIFILATTEIHKVPATIISRCQRFDFKKVNAEELVKRLSWICQQENIKVDKKVFADIARVSEGCLRDAESLLGQILSLGEKEITAEEASLIIPATNYNYIAELVDYLVYKNIEGSVNLINKLVEESIDLLQFTDELIEFLRKMILGKISGSLAELATDLDEAKKQKIVDLADKFTLAELVSLVNLFSAKKLEIKSAAIAQLPLEIAVIEYCQNKGKDGEKGQEGKDGAGGGGVSSSMKNKDNPIEEKKVPDKTNQDKEAEVKESGVNSATLKNADSCPKPAIAVSLEAIKDNWHAFLVKLQDSNASLVFILKVAEPLELNANVLKVGFRYAFHEQRVNQSKVRESVEQALREFFGSQIILTTCLLAADYQSDFINRQTAKDDVELVAAVDSGETPAEQQELIETLVKTFNGKIVE